MRPSGWAPFLLATLLLAAPRRGASVEIAFEPLPIGSFEVTWTLDSKGYGTFSHVVLQGKYTVYAKRTGGMRDDRGFCKELLSITYGGGGIVSAEGANSVGGRALFGNAGPPAGSQGMVCRRGDGSIEIRLPAPKLKFANTAAEEAAGCFAGEPEPNVRMSPAAYHDLASRKKTMRWEASTTPEEREAAPECQATATIELNGKLPRIVLGETCREGGGAVSAPATRDAATTCKRGEFDGFRVVEVLGHEPY